MFEVVTERLRLRPFQAADLPAFVAYRSHPEVARYQSWDETYSMTDAERFLGSQQGVVLGEPGAWVQLAVVDRDGGGLCGDCAVRVLDDPPATAELGVTLAPDRQGRGLANEALTAVITRLFEDHDLRRVFAQADDRNIAVHRLLEGLGFRCEARLVEADWFKDEWSTLRIYGLLAREWATRGGRLRRYSRSGGVTRWMTEQKQHRLPTPVTGGAADADSGSRITRVDLYSYELTYVGGEYVMSGNRVIRALDSTVVRIETAAGRVGFGETCPLGAGYLPAHAAGARAALQEVAPHVLGLDAADPAGVSAAMDAALLGHEYAKSALDVACWDVFGQVTGRPICDLIGGRRQDAFPLYVAISLDTPQRMTAQVASLRERGVHRFQLKLGNDPSEDAARARAVIDATSDEDVVFGDANRGWSLPDAIVAAREMDDLPRFFLEQPCATYDECLRVRDHTRLPMILDEVITDLPTLLRAWDDRALDGINLKINRVGGMTKARLLRDVGQQLGLIVNVEDSWGGDLTTAAVSHLAASTSPEAARMVSFMNDWTNEHVAGHQPRSENGIGSAPRRPGLGVDVDVEMLGPPFASLIA